MPSRHESPGRRTSAARHAVSLLIVPAPAGRGRVDVTEAQARLSGELDALLGRRRELLADLAADRAPGPDPALAPASNAA